uniref:C-type lectin domain-containing protein n=1 Tax=Panagrolaimus davidi TaxID=227884 RepID=A0A914QAQ5_9BILA
MDGTSFDFSDWENAQPQNVSNCGAVVIQGEKWISADCDKQKPFVCLIHVPTEISPQPSTTTVTTTTTTKITTTISHVKACLPLWSHNPSTSFCYKVFDNMNWLDAE